MESKWLVRVAGVVVGILLASTPVFAQEYAGIQMPAFTNPSLTAPAPEAVSGKRGVLVPLYVSFAVLQALDMKSTRTAIGDGAREANPVMTGVVGSPAAFFALKAATGAAVVFAAEKMRTRNRVAAMATMAALNSLYATIVTHNYAVAGR
jgi:hypothetical protein